MSREMADDLILGRWSRLFPKTGVVWGSDSFLLQKSRRQRNEPSAKQFNPGPAVHMTLDRLQPIDLTFYRSVAPFFGDRCFYRQNVLPQLVREVTNQGDPTQELLP